MTQEEIIELVRKLEDKVNTANLTADAAMVRANSAYDVAVNK